MTVALMATTSDRFIVCSARRRPSWARSTRIGRRGTVVVVTETRVGGQHCRHRWRGSRCRLGSCARRVPRDDRDPWTVNCHHAGIWSGVRRHRRATAQSQTGPPTPEPTAPAPCTRRGRPRAHVADHHAQMRNSIHSADVHTTYSYSGSAKSPKSMPMFPAALISLPAWSWP